MATKKLPPHELFATLQKCDDYRTFIKTYLNGRSLNFSDFARASNFGRSFPSDVVSGKRRLTAKSAYSFEKALRLPLPGKKLFRFLVAREESDTFPEINRELLPQAIRDLQTKSWQAEHRKIKELEFAPIADVIANTEAMAVYAAAGTPEQGALLSELETRTRIYGKELERIVQSLESIGFLEKKEQHYYPKDLHTFLQTQDQSLLLTNVFQKSCRLAMERVALRQNDREMFFTSNICIREENMPNLKLALRELILKFVDDSTQPDGDRVVRLLTSLHL